MLKELVLHVDKVCVPGVMPRLATCHPVASFLQSLVVCCTQTAPFSCSSRRGIIATFCAERRVVWPHLHPIALHKLPEATKYLTCV